MVEDESRDNGEDSHEAGDESSSDEASHSSETPQATGHETVDRPLATVILPGEAVPCETVDEPEAIDEPELDAVAGIVT